MMSLENIQGHWIPFPDELRLHDESDLKLFLKQNIFNKKLLCVHFLPNHFSVKSKLNQFIGKYGGSSINVIAINVILAITWFC